MQIIRKKVRSLVGVFLALLLYTCSGVALAEIIDDISLKTDANGEVDAIIKFTVPVQRLRYFPPRKSTYFVVYFNILESVSRDKWQDYESHRSPPSDLIRGFTVTTRDLNTGPKIEIQFNSAVESSLRAGKDNQTVIVHIKLDQPKQDMGSQSALLPMPAAGVPPNLPPSVPEIPDATPTAPLATESKTILPEAATNDVAATPPVIPKKPGVARSSTPLKNAPLKFLVKDGLPVFPEIEPAVQETNNDLSTESMSLEDQIIKANNQAAELMAKGRDALKVGEMFAAIEALNNTLKLPSNKYTQDAQIWIAIARERSGQITKAKLEYETYLKLYPDGVGATWVKERLAKLNAIQPELPSPVMSSQVQQLAPVVLNRKFETTEYGSFSMYYYHGSSHTDTIATVGTIETPSSLTVTDQSSLINNLSLTGRFYNDEYDNRLIFQDFYAANFLPGQQNKNRLNAAYFESRNRIKDYSARIGRQSALGGGVMGRFDGVSGGYGFLQDWRANAVAGQLSDTNVGTQPVFYGASLDFGVKSQIGGTFYAINQTVGGIADRKAMGGNLRYFDYKKTAIAMLDYDLHFREVNMVTLQGTLNSESGTDYNFLVDSRKTPSLSIRSALNGTTASIDTLRQNGWTMDDLLALARLRTATSNVAQFGITNHIKEKWQVGTDVVVSNTSGMKASGTLNPDGTTGVEGFVPASSSTGNTWTISERLLGNDVLFSHDVSMLSLSYTESRFLAGTTLLLNNHTPIQELWTIDTTLRLYRQTDSLGGKQTLTAPTLKLSYRVKSYLTVETEGGLEVTKAKPSALQSSRTSRKYFTFGFRWDF